MKKQFKYRFENNLLIIDECPNDILTVDMISSIKEGIPNCVYINEGIKEIGKYAFNNVTDLIEVHLSNSLKKIGESSFSCCKNLKNIVFSDSIESIENNAFFCCSSLVDLKLPSSLKKIGYKSFSYCSSLKKVCLPACIEEIGESAFENCIRLNSINIPEGITKLNNNLFHGCGRLNNIKIPLGVKELGQSTFFNCNNLKKIYFNEDLEKIGNNCFQCCNKLKVVNLPISLKNIGKEAFLGCSSIENIEIPCNVVDVGVGVFKGCEQLEDISLSSSLKIIPSEFFSGCSSLKKIYIPDSVINLGQRTFEGCVSLKSVRLSNKIDTLPTECFSYCWNLENINIDEGIKEIGSGVFSGCASIRNICLPSTLDVFYSDSLGINNKFPFIILNTFKGSVKIDIRSKIFISDSSKKLALYDYDKNLHCFYNNGEYIEFPISLIEDNKRIKKIFGNHFIHRGDYTKLYYWVQKKYIPSIAVIKNMPLKDIDKFYVNDNGHEWSKLIKKLNITSMEEIGSFFKLCYVLGVFSESTSIRDKAVNFLNEKIVDVLDGLAIHRKFDAFNIENGFNEEYAEFFMKYYSNYKDFMVTSVAECYYADLTCSSYNNFKKVKLTFPNKTLHTNRRADLLTPNHVMSAIRFVEYTNVNDGNENFAKEIGKYGYTQIQFEKLQSWYDQGKKIDSSNAKLFICEDDNENGITYKLLSKSDPLGAVLGNITNCCQVIDGMGEKCLEYGMIMPNSGFLTFNFNDEIIGQSWVWYDEKSQTICLDNIEIPHKYLEKISNNKKVQKNFIECLERISDNFKKEMKSKGKEVKKVVVGLGHNDIKEILKINFNVIDSSILLSGYNGYSDAETQCEIDKIEKIKTRK